MTAPLVSIVIPCYNCEAFLPQTLASVRAQTYSPLEIILVNDGSTDGTGALIEALGAEATAIHTPNRGAANARNTGTAAARGELIQYLDADDLLEPDALERRVRALHETGADVAYGDWRYLREGEGGSYDDAEPVARRIDEVDADPVLAFFTTFWSPPAALLYTRRIVQAIGGWKQHLAPIEDARFMLDAALCGARFVHVPGVSARYRVSRTSHSRRNPVAFLGAVLRNASELEALWSGGPGLPPRRREALVDCYNYVARTAFAHDAGLFDEAYARLARVRRGRGPLWPRIAAALQATLGRRLALRLMGDAQEGQG